MLLCRFAIANRYTHTPSLTQHSYLPFAPAPTSRFSLVVVVVDRNVRRVELQFRFCSSKGLSKVRLVLRDEIDSFPPVLILSPMIPFARQKERERGRMREKGGRTEGLLRLRGGLK